MSKKFQIREGKRYAFRAPVEIRWMDSGQQCHFVRGTSHDVSIFGLGVSVPGQVPCDRELTVILKGVEVCGGAVLRHSQPCESGFRIGLYFRLTLLMQNIPGLDELLDESSRRTSKQQPSIVPVLVRRFASRFWRIAARNARPTLPKPSFVDGTAAHTGPAMSPDGQESRTAKAVPAESL